MQAEGGGGGRALGSLVQDPMKGGASETGVEKGQGCLLSEGGQGASFPQIQGVRAAASTIEGPGTARPCPSLSLASGERLRNLLHPGCPFLQQPSSSPLGLLPLHLSPGRGVIP